MRSQVHVAYNAANEGDVVAVEILDLWVLEGDADMEIMQPYKKYSGISVQ